MKTVSCIIPAYNESPRIEGVLTAVINHPLLHEIIVVDDGSTDATREVATRYVSKGVRLIEQGNNMGKTAALSRGVRESSGELLLFLDADLCNLTAAAITELLTPVLDNQSSVSISLRKNAPALWHWIGLDYISGERVIPRPLIENRLSEIERLPPFGLEVFLNGIFIQEKVRLTIVRWPTVSSPLKETKSGLRKGILGDIHMMRDIFRTITVFEAVRQIYTMRYTLSV